MKLRVFLIFWRLLWLVAMPWVLFYLWRRGRRDRLYSQHLSERFGHHQRRDIAHVWIHAVSIGELRSAVPVIEALLARGEHVVTTHFTPAGRREAQKLFADAVADGRLSAVWVPFDYGKAFRRFFRAFRPKFGLVMEVEFWPGMIMSARGMDVPLFLCNGQYPTKSFEKDKNKRLSRADVLPGFAGVMVKSEEQAARFRSLGVSNVAITGEMRFEQPIPEAHLTAASRVRPALAKERQVIGFASVVEGEDDVLLSAMQTVIAGCRKDGQEAPVFVYVPRAPERFSGVGDMLEAAGLVVKRRSVALDSELAANGPLDCDVLLGDSLGEMFFYLALCDRVLVGGGFTAKGSHNIIEPLELCKPVLVGPETWTIDFPAEQAMAAGVCVKVEQDQLADVLYGPDWADDASIKAFLEVHGGAVEKTLAALQSFGMDIED